MVLLTEHFVQIARSGTSTLISNVLVICLITRQCFSCAFFNIFRWAISCIKVKLFRSRNLPLIWQEDLEEIAGNRTESNRIKTCLPCRYVNCNDLLNWYANRVWSRSCVTLERNTVYSWRRHLTTKHVRADYGIFSKQKYSKTAPIKFNRSFS